MGYSFEEIAGWLREAADDYSIRAGECQSTSEVVGNLQKAKSFWERADQVEAMGQQFAAESLMLEEMAGALMAADKFADDYHWAICSSLRGKIKQALQKYQQSKVQP